MGLPSRQPRKLQGTIIIMTTIRTFIERMYSNSPENTFIEICSTHPIGWNVLTFPADDLEAIITHLQNQPSTADVYSRVTLSTVSGRRGAESDAAGSFWLWAEIDPYALNPQLDPTSPTYEEECTQRIENTISTLKVDSQPPTFYVKSGRGVHAYWKLKEFCTDLVGLKARTAHLSHRHRSIGADYGYDLARVMRVPGTVNQKTTNLTALIEGSGREYDITEFAATPIQRSEILEITISSELLPSNFIAKIRENNEKLADRILSAEGARTAFGLGPLEKIDRSANDWAVVCALLELEYTPGQVLSVLSHPTWFAGLKTQERNNGYAEYTIASVLRGRASTLATDFFVGEGRSKKFKPERVSDYMCGTDRQIINVQSMVYLYQSSGVYVFDDGNLLKHEIYKLLRTIDCWTTNRADNISKTIRASDNTARTELDNHTNLLNVQNGMLNLTTRELIPHRPKYLSTYQLPVIYQEDCDFEFLDTFVASTIPADTIDVFWEQVGNCFVSDYRYRSILLLVGPAYTGKSTLLNVIAKMLGETNVSAASLESLANDPFAVSSLVGKLANICGDISTHVNLLGTERVKRLVSADELMEVNPKYVKQFEARIRAKLLFAANKFPTISSPDDALLSRFCCIPCDFVKEEPDNDLHERLSDSAVLSAALYRALQGYDRLTRPDIDRNRTSDGFSYSTTIEETRRKMLFSVDSVAEFWEEKSEIVPDCDVQKSKVHGWYSSWCAEQNRKPVGRNKFYQRTTELKIVRVIWKKGGLHYRGRKLNVLTGIIIGNGR